MFAFLAFLLSVVGVPVDALAVVAHPGFVQPAALVVAAPEPAPPVPVAPVTVPVPVAQAWDFGPWNGLVNCESGFDPWAHNAHSSASGLFQFLDTTWDWVAADAGRFDLVGLEARQASVQDQYLMAVHLRDMPGGGIGHWVCGWAYGQY